MADRNQLKRRFAAFDVAMLALAGRVTPRDIDRLQARFVQVPADMRDNLDDAVAGFVREYRRDPRDRARVAQLGARLSDYIRSLNYPVPPDIERRDIHG